MRRRSPWSFVGACALAIATASLPVAAQPGAPDAGADAGAERVAALVHDLDAVANAPTVDLEHAIRAARKQNRDLEVGLSQVADSEPGAADALRIVRALRGLAKVGTTDAVRAIARAAPDHGGLFRWEAGELLAELGDRAVPGLIIEWRTGAAPAVRRFAGAQLETMEKRMPGEAIQTKSQDLLGEVLRAYGTAKDMDALGVVLSFTNADRDGPREAARLAILDYGAAAATKLRDAYTSFMNRPPPDDWAPDRLARELFAAYDRDRRREMYQLLEDGLAVAKRAQEKTPPDPALLEQAVQAFDKILARAPTLERRAEMVPAYVLLAKTVETSAPERATLLYRKAADLDPQSPRMPQIQAGLLALQAKELAQRGVPDEESLRRAVALDPANALAQTELARIEQTREQRTAKLGKLAWLGAAVAGVGLALLAFFGWRSRLRG